MLNFNRRNFAKLMAAGAGAVTLPASAQSGSNGDLAAPSQRPLIKPARLREGDLVGLITPSGHLREEQIGRSMRNLESLGLRYKLGRHVREIRGNYAGTVAQRLEDLHAMFADPEIKAVWAMAGGSGAISLLPFIDYQLIRKNPKVLIGYSDVTALHLAIHRQTGLVTFHGPIAGSTFTEYTQRHLRAVLMAPQPVYTIPMAEENRARAAEASQFGVRIACNGVATGRLIGGNLSLFSALSGTAYAGDYGGHILFLEDVSEAPYRIDRMMTQVNLQLGFDRAAAVMLGIFDKCEAKDGDISLTLAETVDDQISELKVPAVYGYSFGHIRHQCTMPMGIMARLDTAAETLTLLEAGVI